MEKEVFLVQESGIWNQIELAAQNAVVQIFAQEGQFNWLEPYKIQDQQEKRGSGFFINDNGYFITNAHVVQEAKTVWIQIPALGRQLLYAHVVSMCPDRDIALLRLKKDAIDAVKNKIGFMPSLSLGDSDQIQRIESVLSLGYPLGQYHLKGTTGVISGRESILGNTLIQITAPINPGNSGGPILNIKGQVIGIAIATIALANNVGFAIPINELKIILEDMYTQKLVHKPLLGAQFMLASDEKAYFFKNPSPPGLYISRVFKGSLLDKAGIRSGDMIYEFNGYQLDPYGDTNVEWFSDKISFFELVSRVKIGQEISLIVYRQGSRIEVTFPFQYQTIFSVRYMYPDFERVVYETIAGMVIMELTLNHIPLLMEKMPDLVTYNLPENRLKSQLVVANILPGSYAHQLRMLQPGDIITHVNEKRVKNINDYCKMIRQSVTSGFLTIRTKQEAFVVFSLKKILADEGRLFNDFGYPMSKTVQRMYRAVERNNNLQA